MSGEPQRTMAFPQKRATTALYSLPLGIALLLAVVYLLLTSGHTENYRVHSIRHLADAADPKLHLTLDKAIPAADQANLVFTVQGEEYPFSASTNDVNSVAGHDYTWAGPADSPWRVGLVNEYAFHVALIKTP